MELARIEEVRQSPILHILDLAVPASRKSSPNRLLFVVAFGLSWVYLFKLKGYFKILNLRMKIMKKLEYFNHETSVIDDGVKIGKGTKVWHFSHIQSNVTIR